MGLHALYENSGIMEMAMKWCGHWNFTTISKARVCTRDYHINGLVTTKMHHHSNLDWHILFPSVLTECGGSSDV